jgi:hypothetical protein
MGKWREGRQAVMVTAAARELKDPTNALLTHTIRARSSSLDPAKKTECVPAAGRTRLTAATDERRPWPRSRFGRRSELVADGAQQIVPLGHVTIGLHAQGFRRISIHALWLAWMI